MEDSALVENVAVDRLLWHTKKVKEKMKGDESGKECPDGSCPSIDEN